MILVAQDAAGLRQAALELMEESLDAPERERMEQLAQNAQNAEAVRDSVKSRRTLSPGYYLWLDFIASEIAAPLEAGITFRAVDLDCEELLGLNALREAKAEFRTLHPPCRRCGQALPDAATDICRNCWTREKQEQR